MKRLLGLLVVTGLAIGCGAEYVTDEVSSLRREVAELREQAADLRVLVAEWAQAAEIGSDYQGRVRELRVAESTPTARIGASPKMSSRE